MMGAIKHGHTKRRAKSPEYRAWLAAIGRCYNIKNAKYYRYGGRGIRMCDKWRSSFKSFLNDIGPRPPNTTLDRINNDGDYEPENTRWADAITQSNNRGNTRWITFCNVTMSIMQWSRRTGINVHTLKKRLKLGWSTDRALTQKPRPKADCALVTFTPHLR